MRSRYGISFESRVSHSLLTWWITSAESPYTSSSLILRSIVASHPNMHASYSAILLVQSKHNLVVKGKCRLSRDVKTAPIPCPNAFEAPLNVSVHDRAQHVFSNGEYRDSQSVNFLLR